MRHGTEIKISGSEQKETRSHKMFKKLYLLISINWVLILFVLRVYGKKLLRGKILGSFDVVINTIICGTLWIILLPISSLFYIITCNGRCISWINRLIDV